MLSDEIKKFFRGEVLTDEATLEKYSEDASIFKIQPEAVVFPKNVEDVKNLVKFVAKSKDKKGKKITLTARAAGTDMTGGPLTESIVVNFTKYFNKIKKIARDYVVVEPGVYYRDLEKETLQKGLIYPPYPASKEICAVGGIVANNGAGEKTLSYGKTEDFVLELKAVLSDGSEYLFKPLKKSELKKKIAQNSFEGKLYKSLFGLVVKNRKLLQEAKPKVNKNSAGYYLWNIWDGETFDITKVLVGSQGTLGLITEVKLKLVPIKKHSRMVIVFLKSFDPLGKLVNTILGSNPESLEAYDDKTLWLAIKFFPGIIKGLIKKYGNLAKVFIEFFPDMVMMLTHGFPKLVLMAEITGDNEKEVIKECEALVEKISKEDFIVRMTNDQKEAEKYWTIRRESFNLLRQKVKNKHTAPFIDDVIVNPEHLPQFLPRLNALIGKYKKLTYTIAGHAGDGNFHVIPLMDFTDPEARASIPKLSEEVFDLVAEFKGSITAEHNDGLVRTPYLHKMYSSKVLKLFEETKKLFDPQDIFNPGKKVRGNLEYSNSHIKTR